MKKIKLLLKYLMVLCLLGISGMSKAQIQNGDFEVSNPLAINFIMANFPACQDGQDNEFYRLWQANNPSNWQFGGIVDLHHRLHWNMGIGGSNNQHMDLNLTGVLTQTISGLTIGRNYTINFITSAHAGLNNNNQVVGNISVRDVNGNPALNQNWTVVKNTAAWANMAWQNVQFNFTANATDEVLRFAGVNTPVASLGVLIDNISMTADSTPCNEGIIPTRIDCNNFNFDITEISTFIRFARWSVNGVFAGEGKSIDLNFPQPGTYTICVDYFGVHRNDTNQTCCGEGCYTIIIPPTEELVETFNACDLDQDGSAFHEYDPFESFGGIIPPNFDHYILYAFDGQVIYDSRNGGTSTHNLSAPGDYSISYFDSNGCVFVHKMIQVHLQQPFISSCTLYRLVNCGSDFNVDTSWRRDSCCTGSFTDSTDWIDLVDTTSVNPLFINLRDPRIVRKVFIDSINCRKCIVTVNIGILRTEIVRYVVLNPCVCTNYSFSQLQALLLSSGSSCTADINNATSFIIRNVSTNNTVTINSSGSFQACPGDEFEVGMTGAYGNGCCVFRLRFICGSTPMPEENDNGVHMGNFDYLFSGLKSVSDANIEGLDAVNYSNPAHTDAKSISLNLIPNPTSAIFKIQSVDGRFTIYNEVTITNSIGQVVLQLNNITSENEIDMSSYSDDLYIINVAIKEERQTLKLIKGKH